MDDYVKIEVGTILVHSIGFGCDKFWQVISSTPKSIKARKLEHKVVNRNIKQQTCDYLPIPNKFEPPEIADKYVKKLKNGKPGFKKVDQNTITLKVVQDEKDKNSIRIGPMKRLMWWNIWDGKQRNQWSN